VFFSEGTASVPAQRLRKFVAEPELRRISMPWPSLSSEPPIRLSSPRPPAVAHIDDRGSVGVVDEPSASTVSTPTLVRTAEMERVRALQTPPETRAMPMAASNRRGAQLKTRSGQQTGAHVQVSVPAGVVAEREPLAVVSVAVFR
jgi:hypothetical protein